MKNTGKSFYILLLAFFLVNLISSALISISKDEAYYWMFARHLDWGFFDHPPLVALFIKAGTMIFPGTLGLRLLTTITSTLTLAVVWKLVPETDRKKSKALMLFFLLAFSMPVFNIYGFITTPDVPLLFFSALYLYSFLRFTRERSAMNALMVGVVAALLMYSKYHGAFLILFALIPHYRLLWNRYFYLAAFVGLLLYLPHIYWQYQHDFISFRYHLLQRTDGFMGGKHILNYILNAFLILNPFFFAMLLYFRFIKRLKSGVPSVFITVFWGFIIFFGFTSLRDHIEPQWIGVAAIPLTVMLVSYLANSDPLPRWFSILAVTSIVLISGLRLGMMLPLPLNTEFHTRKAPYYEYIREKSAGDRVMFINSYSSASRYTYYTGEPAFSYNCYDYRKNQFDLWDYEKTYHKENIFFISGYAYPWTDSILEVERDSFYYKRIPDFPMINKVTGEILSIEKVADRNGIHSVSFTVKNPYDYPLEFADPINPMRFFLVYQTGRTRFLTRLGAGPLGTLGPGEQLELTGYYYPTVEAGEYEVAVGLQPGRMSPVLITEKTRLTLQ